MIGPSDTPYADILFLFDIYLPPNYPEVPPKVYFWSYGERREGIALHTFRYYTYQKHQVHPSLSASISV